MLKVPIDVPSFSPYKPLQNVHFCKSVTRFFFQELYSHIDKKGYVSRQNSKQGNLLKSSVKPTF